MRATPYIEAVLENMPRLLSLLDRNPLSKTYGCFDRQYWHYTAMDFPCARSQEAVLTLALLYKTADKLNPYHGNGRILEWVHAALDYWTRMQDANGSFSEWYPRENSFVATVFSSYAVSETLLELGDLIKNRERVISSLEKAACWFMGIDEDRAVNQETGAALALYNLYLLTKKQEYLEACVKKIRFAGEKQHEEGWFPEYGGADIGYLSLAIDYLAKYYKKSGDASVLPILEKAVSFIAYFVHPGDTFGGEYGSRNTAYMIPDGFEILAPKIPAAALISASVRASLAERNAAWPGSLDDRYLSYIGYTFLQAYLDSDKDIAPSGTLPRDTFFVKDFKGAGLLINSSSDLYLITNYRKGGAYKAFYKKTGKSVTDCGLQVETVDGSRLVSAWLTDPARIEIRKDGVTIEGSLKILPANYLSPAKNVFLRTFQLTLGTSPKVSRTVKNALRDKLITKTGSLDYRFTREITLEEEGFSVRDSLDAPARFDKVIVGGPATYIYTPSSRYFQESDMLAEPIVLGAKDIGPWRHLDVLVIMRRYERDGSLAGMEVGDGKEGA